MTGTTSGGSHHGPGNGPSDCPSRLRYGRFLAHTQDAAFHLARCLTRSDYQDHNTGGNSGQGGSHRRSGGGGGGSGGGSSSGRGPHLRTVGGEGSGGGVRARRGLPAVQGHIKTIPSNSYYCLLGPYDCLIAGRGTAEIVRLKRLPTTCWVASSQRIIISKYSKYCFFFQVFFLLFCFIPFSNFALFCISPFHLHVVVIHIWGHTS